MPPLDDPTIRRRLPQPIALAWHRMDYRVYSDAERRDRLIGCNEILLRTLVAFLLPDYLRGPRVPQIERQLPDLQEFSAGKWFSLTQAMIRHLGQRRDPSPFMPEAQKWFFTEKGQFTAVARAMKTVVELRNEVVHPDSAITPVEISDRVAELREAMRFILGTLEWMLDYRPFQILSSDAIAEGTFRGDVQFLVGAEEETRPAAGEWNIFFLKRSVYLANPAGNAVLLLSPFLEILADSRTGLDHLYLFKHAPGFRQIVRASDGFGSQITSSLFENKTAIAFKDWLERRKSITFFREIQTSNGVFRGGSRHSDEGGGDLGARYLKISELGRGGMAVVYRVRDTVLRKDFALKVMNRELAEEENYLKRFDREAEAMRMVQHPRIVEMIDVDKTPTGQPFIKMPIMKGGSLQERIVRPGGCSEELVRGWAADALEGLVEVHKAGIVHRDIKPSNFLIADDGRATLTDFGIALGTGDARLTRTLDQMGTVQYMAPEQRTNRTVDSRADIFSLAVVLHELRTGELPERDPGVGIDGQLGEVIRRMGALSPNDRPSAADALRMLHEAPVPQPAPRPVARPLRKSQAKAGATTTAKRRRITPAQMEAELSARAETMRQQELREKEAEENRRYGKIVALAVLAFVFMLNYAETAIETWLRTKYRIGVRTEQLLAAAAHAFEGDLDFVHHDATSDAVAMAFSSVYFIVFPAIAILAIIALTRMRDSRPLLVLSTAAMIDYAIALPFFLFFPVPERWAYAPSNAIVMSDLLTTKLIQAFRPISGLNNCFPSFHVSATVVLVLCLYRAPVPFRAVTVPLGLAIILSTFALGIHWLPDIIAGLASGIISIWAAERLLDRLPAMQIPFLSRLVSDPA